MANPYVRFEDITFDTEERRDFCKMLYKQIREQESVVIEDETFYEFIKTVNEQAAAGSFMVLEINRKALHAMKIVFLYYTGVPTSKILLEEEVNDIFSLF